MENSIPLPNQPQRPMGGPAALQPQAIAPHRIHPQTRPAYVHLKVADLDREIEFYQHLIGLRLHWKDAQNAGLGAGGRDLLRLTQIQNGRRYRGVSGLYHFAILFPNRRELARAVARLFANKWLNYPTDHIMTKTTYLDDPEGNHIELYCESPEDGVFGMVNGEFIAMRQDGSLSDGREPLDLETLFAHLSPQDRLDEPVPQETRLGHFHLYVGSLQHTMAFYHGLLGFDNMGIARSFRMGMVSAGGYHHHIGFNTWQGEGAPPAPADALGMLHFAFDLPHIAEFERLHQHLTAQAAAFELREDGLALRDPSDNPIVFLKPQP
ncbi:MAG: VOC family protein [Chloroflexota bacterium]